MSNADLRNAFLSHADLSGATLINVQMANANFSNAALPFSLVSQCAGSRDAIYDSTDFSNAIIDDESLATRLKEHNIAPTFAIVKSKFQLRRLLNERGLTDYEIENLLKYRSLPEEDTT